MSSASLNTAQLFGQQNENMLTRIVKEAVKTAQEISQEEGSTKIFSSYTDNQYGEAYVPYSMRSTPKPQLSSFLPTAHK